MPSSLAWLDHDPAARDRSLRILSLFREKESRDELGIGGIRDAIADRLFPGTSTIQTRLRYMLLVPWMYQELERRRVPSSKLAAEARQAELALVQPLLDANEQGVFGSQAGSGLKRLPSSVYWAGLGAWEIRRYAGSQSEYHRSVDVLYARRGRTRQREDDDVEADTTAQTWHPRLPDPPEGFPAGLTLSLAPEEASFLRDRIVTSCKGSLLEWLVLHGRADDAVEPWLHQQYAEFPSSARALLEHARLLTDAVEGAARRGSAGVLVVRDRERGADRASRTSASAVARRCAARSAQAWLGALPARVRAASPGRLARALGGAAGALGDRARRCPVAYRSDARVGMITLEPTDSEPITLTLQQVLEATGSLESG